MEPDYAKALALLEELQERANRHAEALGYVRRMWQEAYQMVTAPDVRRWPVNYWQYKREAYAEVWQVLDPADFAAHVQSLPLDEPNKETE